MMANKTTAPDGRVVTEVSLGVLIDRQQGVYLMGSRPEGKPYAGFWEFPGGKLEVGETAEQALKREFKEELGLTLTDITPWFVLEHSYEHAYVRLHYHRVWAWEGLPQSLEKQDFAWFDLGKYRSDIRMLPMNDLVVRRMTVPEVLFCVKNPQKTLEEGAFQPPEGIRSGLLLPTNQEENDDCRLALQKLSQRLALEIYSPQPDGATADEVNADGFQQSLFTVMSEKEARKVFENNLNRCPVMVEAELKDRLAWINTGAHGVCVHI